ncbi:hypothetical protein BU15DRAFT_60456 [Melanogaster broomeanus]|nr:hypothetical protein BU15DRAFT_60456 [Melanogaster broomeanus]
MISRICGSKREREPRVRNGKVQKLKSNHRVHGRSKLLTFLLITALLSPIRAIVQRTTEANSGIRKGSDRNYVFQRCSKEDFKTTIGIRQGQVGNDDAAGPEMVIMMTVTDLMSKTQGENKGKIDDEDKNVRQMCARGVTEERMRRSPRCGGNGSKSVHSSA